MADESPVPRFNALTALREFIDLGLYVRFGVSAGNVWQYLVVRADKTGLCFPPLPRIAHDLGFAENTVRTALRRLAPILSVEAKGNGRGHPTQYRLACDLSERVQQMNPLQRVQQMNPLDNMPTGRAMQTVKGATVEPFSATKGAKYEPFTPSIKGANDVPPVPPPLPPLTPKKTTQKRIQNLPPIPLGNIVQESLQEVPQSSIPAPLKFDSVDQSLTEALGDAIRESYRDDWHFAGSIDRHCHQMFLLRTKGNGELKGGIGEERIRAVIEWLRHDAFWLPKGNLRSVDKFRQQFPRLEIQVTDRSRPRQNGNHSGPAYDADEWPEEGSATGITEAETTAIIDEMQRQKRGR